MTGSEIHSAYIKLASRLDWPSLIVDRTVVGADYKVAYRRFIRNYSSDEPRRGPRPWKFAENTRRIRETQSTHVIFT